MKNIKTITLFDTSISSSNLGDQIIMDSVKRILNEQFENALFIPVQTHDVISKNSYRFINNSELKFVGGTNLLSSNMNKYNQWKIGYRDAFFINDIVLMGVGWWQYQHAPNAYTRFLYNRVLSKRYAHSVRDSYTEKQLRAAGLTNVINTACPTMWRLDKQHCSEIPTKRSKEVVMTFTEYNQNIDLDGKLLDILLGQYERVHYWTQQPRDYDYMRKLAGDRVNYIRPNLESLDAVLSGREVDYIGTRLHAGVRALQHKRRTLIVSVDNRATEISRDTNLPVVQRDDLAAVKSWITNDYRTEIILPEDRILTWKEQFKEAQTQAI